MNDDAKQIERDFLLFKNENALTAKQALSILDKITEACYQLDHECIIKYVNKPGQALLGVNDQALINRNFWDVFAADHDTGLKTLIANALQNGQDSQQVYISKVFNTAISASAATDENGCLLLIRTTQDENLLLTKVDDDIDHAELRQKRSLLDGIEQSEVVSLNIFRAIRNDEGKIADLEWLFANKSSMRFANQHQLKGKRYNDIFPELVASGIMDQYKRVIDTGEPHDYEFRYQGSNGSGWFRSVAVKLDDGILVTAEDITGRKKAEQDLIETTSLLQSIYDNLPISISILVPQYSFDGSIYDFKIKIVNRQLERETGRLDLVGKLYRKEYPGVDKVGIVDIMLRVMTTGVSEQAEFHYTFEGFNKWFSCMFIKTYNGILATNLDISKRKNDVDELRRNYQVLRQAEQVAGIGSWSYELSNGEITWSEGMYDIFGIPFGTPVTAETFLIHAVNEDVPTVKRVIEHFQHDHEAFEDTICIDTSKGKKLLLVKGVPLLKDDSVITHIIGVGHDLTTLKRSERDLVEQHERMIEAQSIGRLGSYEYNIESERVYWSDELYDIMGVPQGTSLDFKSTLAHYVREDAEKLSRLAIESVRNASGFELEASFRRLGEKEIRNLCIINKVVVDRAGKVTRLRGIAQDITERKRSATQILRMQELLAQEAKDKYQQLFNSIDEGFCIGEAILDEAGNTVDFRFLEANPAFHQQMGSPNVEGKTIRDLDMDKDQLSIEMLAKVITTHSPVRFVLQQRDSAHWFDVHAFSTPYPSENAIAILIHDITKRKESEQEAKRLYNELRKSDREKTDFFSNVSHEFRTPLTLMLAPLADLGKTSRKSLTPTQFEKLDLVRRNALRLQKLVNTLLDFSRIERGQMDAVFQPTDIVKSTLDIASNFRSIIEESGLKFVLKFDDLKEPLYINRVMFEKIVLNLLTNAYKYTFEGKISLLIKVKKLKVELKVIDTGIGISRLNQGRIFERFVRVENSRSRTIEGTGIGLALVKEMVSIHGGDIVVKSEVGRGATFTVTIPRGKGHLDKAKIFDSDDRLAASPLETYMEEVKSWRSDEIEKKAKSILVEGNDKAKPIILVADDNADMRKYLSAILGESYQVVTAENGRKAIDILKSGLLPDLVLTDVMMPDKDGYDVLYAMKRDEAFKQIPIILVTAQTGEEAKVDGFHYGADDYIGKPFSSRELVARVDARIQISKLQKQVEKGLLDNGLTLEKTVQDRTAELQKSNETLARRNQELITMNEELANLTFAASHDLREPSRKLSFFLLQLLSMVDATALSELGKEYVERINVSMKLLNDLITDLSMYTYFNERPVNVEVIPMSTLLSEILESLTDRIIETNATFKIDIHDGAVGDYAQVRQLLRNLISNAIKFRQKDRSLLITITGRSVLGSTIEDMQGDSDCMYYELTVQDNGIGFAQEYEKQIFKLFRKLHVRGDYPGTGIGLTIARKIVTNHGGFILTRSKPGDGSTFIVYLPINNKKKEPSIPIEASDNRLPMIDQ